MRQKTFHIYCILWTRISHIAMDAIALIGQRLMQVHFGPPGDPPASKRVRLKKFDSTVLLENMVIQNMERVALHELYEMVDLDGDVNQVDTIEIFRRGKDNFSRDMEVEYPIAERIEGWIQSAIDAARRTPRRDPDRFLSELLGGGARYDLKITNLLQYFASMVMAQFFLTGSTESLFACDLDILWLTRSQYHVKIVSHLLKRTQFYDMQRELLNFGLTTKKLYVYLPRKVRDFLSLSGPLDRIDTLLGLLPSADVVLQECRRRNVFSSPDVVEQYAENVPKLMLHLFHWYHLYIEHKKSQVKIHHEKQSRIIPTFRDYLRLPYDHEYPVVLPPRQEQGVFLKCAEMIIMHTEYYQPMWVIGGGKTLPYNIGADIEASCQPNMYFVSCTYRKEYNATEFMIQQRGYCMLQWASEMIFNAPQEERLEIQGRIAIHLQKLLGGKKTAEEWDDIRKNMYEGTEDTSKLWCALEIMSGLILGITGEIISKPLIETLEDYVPLWEERNLIVVKENRYYNPYGFLFYHVIENAYVLPETITPFPSQAWSRSEHRLLTRAPVMKHQYAEAFAKNNEMFISRALGKDATLPAPLPRRED